MKTVQTSSGVGLPRIGQGTWEMGKNRRQRADEVRALQLGLDLGMTLVDTAEMYADGGAEEVVGEAIRGRRDEVYLVSKVLPENASRKGTILAAERSLRRLGIDVLDLHLLHWEGSHPLEETLAAFGELRESGKIRAFGISNFDLEAQRAAQALPGGDGILANQVLYHLSSRGIERNLLRECQRKGIVVMAYSPLAQGRLSGPALDRVAHRHGATPEQVALAWTVRHDGVVTIPKASQADHVRQNAAADALVLSEDDLAALDAAFPPPQGPAPLEIL